MSSNRRTQSITFRLPHELCESLDVLASAQGISRGHWVRGQVMASISRPTKDDLSAVLNDLLATGNAIEEQQRQIKRALIRHLYYTLTYAGSVEHQLAESLAKEKLFSEGRKEG